MTSSVAQGDAVVTHFTVFLIIQLHTWDSVAHLQCDYTQGWYYSRRQLWRSLYGCYIIHQHNFKVNGSFNSSCHKSLVGFTALPSASACCPPDSGVREHVVYQASLEQLLVTQWLWASVCVCHCVWVEGALHSIHLFNHPTFSAT